MGIKYYFDKWYVVGTRRGSLRTNDVSIAFCMELIPFKFKSILKIHLGTYNSCNTDQYQYSSY